MQYEHDRTISGKANEPALSEMTTKAIDILAKNKKGYFLMVEAGRLSWLILERCFGYLI
jgi:alkaline phosphatase